MDARGTPAPKSEFQVFGRPDWNIARKDGRKKERTVRVRFQKRTSTTKQTKHSVFLRKRRDLKLSLTAGRAAEGRRKPITKTIGFIQLREAE